MSKTIGRLHENIQILPPHAARPWSRMFGGIALGLILIVLSPPTTTSAAVFNHQHSLLDAVLKKHVSQGLVDYKALKKSPQVLRDYLLDQAQVKESDFKAWTESQQLAFLINLYNAATLGLIIDYYPLESIKDIGWILKGPWDQKVVRLFGKTMTLNHLEHEILRKRFNEPRLHFAIVCAARGCPPLRAEAYTAAQLEMQLQEQGQAFLSNPRKNRVEPSTKILYLSPIFKWFDEDFIKAAGSVQAFVAPFFAGAERSALEKQSFRIRYTNYDWSLNEK